MDHLNKACGNLGTSSLYVFLRPERDDNIGHLATSAYSIYILLMKLLTSMGQDFFHCLLQSPEQYPVFDQKYIWRDRLTERKKDI